ncbi:MAG: hypothetical protein HFE51_09865 [Clostridia bacterium]|nr:hypothetical protein [Clostridia bacterium]NDO20311.1 hypothetical protein [Lachnospiraceae bacterium MD329]
MFYKVLFILTALMIIRTVIRYVKEIKSYVPVANVMLYEGIPLSMYVRMGGTALFYIMVLTLTLRPHLFWW